MSLTTLLVPTYLQMLTAMSGWLDKAQAQTSQPEADALMSARLAPDMFPLSSQVRFACFQAQEATFRLQGTPMPQSLNDLALEGRNAGEAPGSVADAQARIAEALSYLKELEPDALDAGSALPIEIALPDGAVFDMTGAQYARDWALPQFYFHLVTAYAIVRGKGIEIGKADYVPHMFGYLRGPAA